MKHSVLKSAACALGLFALALPASTAALAGPMYTFSTSTGTQPSNAGVITLTQNGANAVDVKVDLINPTYGFVNTGGPHTPFAFNLAGSGALSIAFTTPVGGSPFSLNTSGGSNTPFGFYNTAIDSSAGNGSVNGYFADLLFTLTRVGGLSTDDFISNGTAYFTADLSNGTNTGAQAWNRDIITRTTDVPEPLTLSLFAAGLAGVTVMRRRKVQTA